MPTFILINNESLTFLRATETIEQAMYWADILAPNEDYRINGLDNKDYSCYTPYELRMLYYNTSGNLLRDNFEYSKLLQGVTYIAGNLPVDDTPIDVLRKKLGRDIDPTAVEPAPEKPTRGKSPSSGSGSGGAPTRPKAGTATGRVWEIADSLVESDGTLPERSTVVEKATAEGINPATVSTQYGKWKKHQLNT